MHYFTLEIIMKTIYLQKKELQCALCFAKMCVLHIAIYLCKMGIIWLNLLKKTSLIIVILKLCAICEQNEGRQSLKTVKNHYF